MRKIRANDTTSRRWPTRSTPSTFVHKINVPVFMACQWQDEQTGGHCPELVERFTGTTRKWFTFTNGTHIDSLDPETFNRWYDFLQLYVAKQAPTRTRPGSAPRRRSSTRRPMGIQDGITLPPDPIQDEPTYEGALAAFEQLAPVRVLFENGAGGDARRASRTPASSGRSVPSRSRAPRARRGTSGRAARSAASQAARSRGADRFTWNAKARPLTNFTGNTAAGDGGLWTATPPYKWESASGRQRRVVSSPRRSQADTTVVGAGAVHAWVRSSKPNVDLQATITEVRPDGKETFVQSGWLRGNAAQARPRAAARCSSRCSACAQRDAAPLPRRRFVKVTIPLYYQGHVYRTDSRIRVTITAPNGDQPIWSFGETRPEAHRDASRSPSRSACRRGSSCRWCPAGTPPPGCRRARACRAQPCRDYSRTRTSGPGSGAGSCRVLAAEHRAVLDAQLPVALGGHAHAAAHHHVAAERHVALHLRRSHSTSDGGPAAKRASKSRSSLKCALSRSTNGTRPSRSGASTIAAVVVQHVGVGAQHEQVVGRLDRARSGVRGTRSAARARRRRRSPRPSRSRAGGPPASPDRRGRRSCGSRSSAGRARRRGPRARRASVAQVHPERVGVEVAVAARCPGSASRSSSGVCATSRSTRPPSGGGARGARPCGRPRCGRPPPSANGSPSRANQARMRGSSTAPRLSEFATNAYS